MLRDKLYFWVLLTLSTGVLLTQINCAVDAPPEQCIEECGCRDMTVAEKKTLKVCGTDGVTHANLCKLICQNCKNNVTLEVRYSNATDIRFAFKICNRTSETPIVWKKMWRPKTPKPTGPTEPTTTKKPKPTKPTTPPPIFTGPTTTLAPWSCDNEQQTFITYGLKHATVKNITFPIKMLHLGACEKKNITEKGSKEKRNAYGYDSSESSEYSKRCYKKCFCPETHKHKHICATNGITYSNKCRMRCDACETRTAIKVAHHGKCH